MVSRNPAAPLERKDRPKIARRTVAVIDPDPIAAAMHTPVTDPNIQEGAAAAVDDAMPAAINRRSKDVG